MDKTSNRWKFVAHGAFYATAITVAEPSTILPLIVNYFTESTFLIGVFSSLLRGGAVLMQLYAAFHAQAYAKVIGKLRIVFFFRFLMWFGIGATIYTIGDSNHALTLVLFAIGLFAFSFSAGFGAVFYQELLGKSFTREYRGKSMAYRQFFTGLSAILSGSIAAWFLNKFDAPDSFAYLFMISSFTMGVGFLIMGTFSEEKKENVSVKEKNFGIFLKNSMKIFKQDIFLQRQIYSRLIAYAFFLVFPFIILQVKNAYNMTGTQVGIIVSLQMAGAMLSNILWGKLSGKNRNKLIILIAYLLLISTLILTLFVQNYHAYAESIYIYYLLFFIAGGALDGLRLAYGNLILILSPEDKRPVYIAIQNNITSIGLFFAIPGGALLSLIGFEYLAILTILILAFGLFISTKLNNN